MNLDYSEHFLRALDKAPEKIQKVFFKQSKLLLQNLRHPSLRAKKYDESKNIWQARVTRDWRFYFSIEGDTYYLHDIISHLK